MESPFDVDEALAWLGDPQCGTARKISAAAWLTQEEGLDSKEMARRSRLSASTLRHIRRLADRLSPAALEKLSSARQSVSLAHAKVIATLPGPAQLSVLERCIAGRWSVRRLEAAVSNRGQSDQAHYDHLSEVVSLQLGHPVTVTARSKPGTGRVVFEYNSLEEFDALMTRIKVDLSEL